MRAAVPRRSREGDPRGTIGVIGLGYVGLATGVAFAHYGRRVVGFDISSERRTQVARGRAPFFEPGFAAELGRVVRSRRLSVAEDLVGLLERCELVFLAVPTPSTESGTVDLTYIRAAVDSLGGVLRGLEGWRGVVVKSTVVPGTTQRVVERGLRAASGRRSAKNLGVASNPEFLSEGTLLADALHPTRIVLGVQDSRSTLALHSAFQGFPAAILDLSPSAAELVKYTANALLATKVSFSNEIARVAESVGVDVDSVMDAVGRDPRLGSKFLQAGPGFGGSCFTKDLRALIASAKEAGIRLEIPAAVLSVNESQPRHLVDMTEDALGALSGRTVAILGLAFKRDTSDVRDSRASPLLQELLRRGARVLLHDPRAGPDFIAGITPSVRKQYAGRYSLVSDLGEALRSADAAILHTDWAEYIRLPGKAWAQLRRRVVVDARRVLNPRALATAGVRYLAVGKMLD
jgi:UDPglucose 6-dehydrogenase